MPTTIKSVCDTAEERLCNPPHQHFAAAADIRGLQRALDPDGDKKLNRAQVKTIKAFLEVVVATAHQ
jgi:hypothetical protein